MTHPALAAGDGLPLGSPSLSDRQRVSVLLQASALLAHLRLAGWRPEPGWKGATVDARGVLRGVRATPGGPLSWPQTRLLDLAGRLFGCRRGELAGRGEARRVARALLSTCRQRLVPVVPDELVRQLLETGGFLWAGNHAEARAALAAEHFADRGRQLWVAGPGRFRRRLLAGAGSLERLHRRLRSGEARAIWRAAGGPSAASSLEGARRLYAQGRFESALESLDALPGADAAALRVASRARLGRLESARRALGRLRPERLSESDVAVAAESAVALHARLGRPAAAGPWVERALGARGGRARRRALLTAASYARDRGDLEEMDRFLELARPHVSDPATAWRWLHVAGLGALARSRPREARRHFERAVRDARRRLGRYEAAALWNDLGVARAELGDLAGAERALVHAVRLHDRIDSPSRTTLALFNLAEVRLRRGRPEGVEEILQRSTRIDRASGNWRGLAHDLELAVRLELARGRPAGALERVEAALAELERRGIDECRGALHALAARAHGWLGRPEPAARSLERAGNVRGRLDPEELPALWALAGQHERALEAARSEAGCGLWRAALSGRIPTAAEWRELERLETYRAARVVADLESVVPGLAGRRRLRPALAVLRRVGNEALATRLERALDGAWRAVAGYLAERPGEPERLAELFRRAGYEEVSLVWRRGELERTIVDGPGGGERRAARVASGRLILEAERIDGALGALLALAVRDWRPPPAPAGHHAAGIVGESPALRAALERARRLAAGEVPILIHGESGTGKELTARWVHRSSARRGGPLLTLNSAALSESLVLSELFGHARGAFTGADRDRAGIFEAARGGTVFLDELGDLPLRAQGMLLRVVEEGEVRRLGENRVRRVDARVVAATHRSLDLLVREGSFRRDLYYRLAVGRVDLPPLRERGRDLELLTRYFLRRFSPDRALALSERALARLRAHDWPGNVRELANALAVAAALCRGGVVRAAHLDLPGGEPEAGGGYHQRVLDFRRRLVREALEACGGNRAAAARKLGVSRQALSYLVRALGLE